MKRAIIEGAVLKIYTLLIVLIITSSFYSQQLKYSEYIHANNIKMWVDAYGAGSHDPYTDDAGLFWGEDSQGQALTAIFADGPLFGFKLRDSIHVHGATYRTGLNPIPFGPSTDNKLHTIAKISRDWQNESNPSLKNVYEFYHENYPVFHGAPFNDKDGNGIYNPDLDTPEYLGDETLWWKSFPNDSNRTRFLFGSPRVNLEIQTTVWGENSRFPDVVYKEYLFINHEPDTMKDFYFAYWSDPDAGNHKDDYVGVDTNLNLAFCYNGDEFDDEFYLERPASVGYLLLDGPIIPANVLDTARYNGDLYPGRKNQNLYSFYYDDNSFDDEYSYEFYSATLQSYNQMQGLLWNGDDIIDPVTNEITKFILNGDPIEGTGWYEGDGNPDNINPGDRRMMMSTGPFNLAPVDTNCVTFAICVARDNGRLNSLAKLKQLAAEVKHHWVYEVERKFPEPKIRPEVVESIPETYFISNNYPNPFNNVTNINLELPQSGNIRVTVYNALGENVMEIFENTPTAGYTTIQLNGAGLSSGVYYYTVLFRGETKLGKFVLLK